MIGDLTVNHRASQDIVVRSCFPVWLLELTVRWQQTKKTLLKTKQHKHQISGARTLYGEFGTWGSGTSWSRRLDTIFVSIFTEDVADDQHILVSFLRDLELITVEKLAWTLVPGKAKRTKTKMWNRSLKKINVKFWSHEHLHCCSIMQIWCDS